MQETRPMTEACPQLDPRQMPYYIEANELRKDIKRIAQRVKGIRDLFLFSDGPKEELRVTSDDVAQDHELRKNLDLALIHLEDGSMRLGKFMQAMDGGVSVYDRATTVGA